MNRYESYKDSGIPWLGEVPAHWTLGNLMYFISCSSGDALPSVLIHKNESNDINIPVIGGNGLFGYTDNSNFTENCLAIGRVGALCGNVHYINYPSWINDNALIVKLRTDKIYLTFLDYFFQSRNLNELASKTAQPLLTGMQVKKEKIAIPPLPEQTAIADYLDNKLGEIDALISKQETLLEKLAEQRTAIITHAVTKGLNAHAPMKNSGVAWLGDVPEHWRVIKLGHTLLNLRTGLNPRSNFELNTSDAENYYVTIQELVNDSIKFTDNTDKINDEALKIINNRSVLKIGDILLSGTGTIGKTALISETPKNWNIKEGVYALTPNLNSVSSSFLLRLFHAKYLLNQMDTLAMGSTVRSVKMADLKFIKIVLPPLPEQTAIANYLDDQTAKIDRLSDTVNQTIASLKEYRSALITQAVTGKIKVI